MHAQLHNRCLWPVDGLDFYVVRVIHECPGDDFHQFLHSGASCSPLSGTKRISSLDAEPPVSAGGSERTCPKMRCSSYAEITRLSAGGYSCARCRLAGSPVRTTRVRAAAPTFF